MTWTEQKIYNSLNNIENHVNQMNKNYRKVIQQNIHYKKLLESIFNEGIVTQLDEERFNKIQELHNEN